MTALTDQLDAARTEARRMMQRAFPTATHQTAASAWVDQLPERFIHERTPRCPHIDARPAQPGFCLVWEGVLRCRACQTAHTTGTARAQLAGTYAGLGDVEEGRCDRCRTCVGGDQLTPGVARSALWVFIFAACQGCTAELRTEGGQLLPAVPATFARTEKRWGGHGVGRA